MLEYQEILKKTMKCNTGIKGRQSKVGPSTKKRDLKIKKKKGLVKITSTVCDNLWKRPGQSLF